jgi:hypothetical protein
MTTADLRQGKQRSILDRLEKKARSHTGFGSRRGLKFATHFNMVCVVNRIFTRITKEMDFGRRKRVKFHLKTLFNTITPVPMHDPSNFQYCHEHRCSIETPSEARESQHLINPSVLLKP